MSDGEEIKSPGDGLVVRELGRTFHQAGKALAVLKGADLTVRPGELVALVGPSGAGKSTLLHCVGLLERQDSGEIWIEGTATSRLSDRQRTRLRRHTIGFVYQYHHLLPEFSAEENIALPQMIAGIAEKKARQRARDLLATIGLEERGDHRPARLSGGEQQRVALARGLANSPSVLLADEPTGNLDPETGHNVFDQLKTMVQGSQLAALIATHNMELAARIDRVLSLESGKVLEVALYEKQQKAVEARQSSDEDQARSARKVWRISFDTKTG
jgi:lipoprotein-releasing system ATP-binding protein